MKMHATERKGKLFYGMKFSAGNALELKGNFTVL